MNMIVTLSGMSTSGKTTFAKAMGDHPQFRKPVSVTTRAMREGEVDGVDYHFVTPETFKAMITNDELLEYEASHTAMYGTSAAEVERILGQGMSVLPILEPEGVISMQAIAAKRNLPFVSVYIDADMPVIMSRFFGRLDEEKAKKGEVNYLPHANRLKVMLEQEMLWPERTNWGLVLSNLQAPGRLEHAIRTLESISATGVIPPTEQPLKRSAITHWSVDDLADMLEQHYVNASSGAKFWACLSSPSQLTKDPKPDSPVIQI